MQQLSDLFDSCVSDLLQTHLLCEKAELPVLTTLLELQELIEQGLAAIPENSVSSSTLTARSDAFEVAKKLL